MTASVCVIGVMHNDAERATLWLQHAKSYATRVIVVDDRSTDDTAGVCMHAARRLRLDLRVINGEDVPMDDIAGPVGRARNYAMALAGEDWLVVLDSDEYLRNFAVPADGRDCLFFPWTTFAADGAARVEDYKLAAFRGDSGARYEGAIHENPTASLRRKNLCSGWAGCRIAHRPQRSRKWKAKAYVHALRAAVIVTPTSARLRWFLGLSYASLGERDLAARELRAAVSTGDADYPFERANALLALGHLEPTHRVRREMMLRHHELVGALESDLEYLAYRHVRAYAASLAESGAPVELGRLLRLFYCF